MDKKYIGTKIVTAEPIGLGDYNKLRGWIIPANEDPNAQGYVLSYEDGYVSWSPAEAFDKAYRPITGMTFGLAVEALKKGFKAARVGWNGKGMWIALMPGLYLPPYNMEGTNCKVNDRTAKYIGKDKPLDSQPYIVMWTAEQKWQPGWLASQADILAEDWQIVD